MKDTGQHARLGIVRCMAMRTVGRTRPAPGSASGRGAPPHGRPWRPTARKSGALYDYLGESTRYVSIQLGIGGRNAQRPERFCKTKFGDCKALSNYMHAMPESAASNRIMPSSTPAAGGCRPISHRPTRPTMPSLRVPPRTGYAMARMYEHRGAVRLHTPENRRARRNRLPQRHGRIGHAAAVCRLAEQDGTGGRNHDLGRMGRPRDTSPNGTRRDSMNS